PARLARLTPCRPLGLGRNSSYLPGSVLTNTHAEPTKCGCPGLPISPVSPSEESATLVPKIAGCSSPSCVPVGSLCAIHVAPEREKNDALPSKSQAGGSPMSAIPPFDDNATLYPNPLITYLSS